MLVLEAQARINEDSSLLSERPITDESAITLIFVLECWVPRWLLCGRVFIFMLPLGGR